ncbi:MAG TPA: AAA-like domain-containing protein [Anaerolineae bacterium]|nr:AAA-like domain-containing protein [Anaerolineae bacterium]
MQRFFNIAGPCHPDQHYMLSAQERCQGILGLVARAQYFVIHAARQTGKTTLLLELAQEINAGGAYYALYCTLESLQRITEPERGIPAIVDQIRQRLRFHPALHRYPFAENAVLSRFTTVLQEELTVFCQQLDKPLVILFDEIDCLSNGTLITFLRQLRAGYVTRTLAPFPHSVALVGMRNIRDYKAHIRDDQETLGSASPFNIVTETLTLRNFTQPEVARLYTQHTEQTGQVFPPEVVEAVFAATQGQPWLVNAIAREIVDKQLAGDYTRPILPEYVEQAVQTLILNRPTHIDSLMERLKEPRVQRIVEPVIMGSITHYDALEDDYRYVLDLGLLREMDKVLYPANPIYGEIILRTLTWQAQRDMEKNAYPPIAPAYLVDGKLDMCRLLSDFQTFWRQNSEIWRERFDYKEAAPHLVLQAFLQRVLNGGGRISRELAEGTGRLDLCVHYGGADYPIELKLRRDAQTYAEGVTQLAAYMERLGCAEGWLIVFDPRKSIAWSRKLFWRTQTVDTKTVHIVGC